MKKIISAAFIFMGLFMSQYSLAGAGAGAFIVSIDSKAVNEVYGGFKWTLGSGSKVPEVVVGHRKTNVDLVVSLSPLNYLQIDSDELSLDGVNGHDISFSINLEELKLSAIRAKYFDGNASTQNELSVGWDIRKGVFIGAGFGAAHSTIGVDYSLRSSDTQSAFSPYITLNSLEKTSLKFGENWTGTCRYDREVGSDYPLVKSEYDSGYYCWVDLP
jgi:hypothetical protein